MNEITSYVAALRARLLLPPAQADRLCEEVETHLLDSVDARGSEEAAVAAFGSARSVALRANLSPAVVPGAVASLARLLLPIATVAVGSVLASALLARLLASLTSTHFVYAPGGGFRASAADCTTWQSLHPNAAGCAAAYTLENRSDSLGLVLLAVPIALLCLGGLALGLRLLHARLAVLAPSGWTSATAGALVFAGAAMVLALPGVLPGQGAGLGWTRVVVAGCIAVCYGVRLVTLGQRAGSMSPVS